jgi:hypothetical protein
MVARVRLLGGMLALVMAPMLVFVPGALPTSAHETYPIWHGNDYAAVIADHKVVEVCDNELDDGHYVYAELYFGLENTVRREADGPDVGCDIETFDFPSGAQAEEFRLCEENKGCTRWYST